MNLEEDGDTGSVRYTVNISMFYSAREGKKGAGGEERQVTKCVTERGRHRRHMSSLQYKYMAMVVQIW